MRYVVLGSSAAGMNAVRELRKLDKAGEIILVSEDQDVYSRCILHHYLGGTRTKEELLFVEKDFETRYDIDWNKGQVCTGVDPEKKQVILADQARVPYDKLLIATGAHTFLPPIPGLEQAKNACGFRNLDDIEWLKERAARAQHPVVMGAGLVGMDTATGLLHLGKPCVVIEMANRLLPKQLDKRAAAAYEMAYEWDGVTFCFEVGVKEVCLNEDNQIEKLILTDGSEVPCDLLIVTAGVRANIQFLEGSGIETDRFGLVIDEHGRTNIPDIYGAGDVTGRSPIWPAAVKEGLIAAANMVGSSRKMTDFFSSKSTMNFMGIPTMSLGFCEKPDDSYQEEIADDGSNYKKVIHKNGKIYGAILQGDLSYAGILTQLISHNIDISKVEKPLFEVDYSDFFRIDENFQFYYDEIRENEHE